MSSRWRPFEVLLPFRFNDGRAVPEGWLAVSCSVWYLVGGDLGRLDWCEADGEAEVTPSSQAVQRGGRVGAGDGRAGVLMLSTVSACQPRC